MKKTATAEKATKDAQAKLSKPAVAMRFRCEICGHTSDKQGKHCGYQMTDLLSDGCMACRGCGMHL
jgi:hypothetical protein